MKGWLIGRFLHGKRGLKLPPDCLRQINYSSLPTREAWIEIKIGAESEEILTAALPTREAWIEILAAYRPVALPSGRFLHGKRGLKCGTSEASQGGSWSLPTREAWIEIKKDGLRRCTATRRFLHGKRGLKCADRAPVVPQLLSLPTREAWIEIGLGPRRPKGP